MQVEICASTLRDVAVAMEVGADRVELCSVWTAGGLTPSAVLVQSAVAMGMPVRALVRPREGHFVWSNSERTWSVEEAKLMLDCGAEAVVVGGLNEEGALDEAYLEALCRAVGPEHVVWHRAIDVSREPEADVDKLLDAGVTSVLSSGGCARAMEGLPRLAQWAQQGLQVVAGGGVQPEDVEAMAAAQLSAVHASCRVTLREGHSPLFDSATHPVDADKAVALMEAAEPFLS
ncbi:MAG: copper homeostasis protein CutC [Flavobacteriales bacterium]